MALIQFRIMRALVLVCAVLLSRAACACLWDFDTIRDEQRGLPAVAEILSGRYERHSRFFYEHRVQSMKALLAADPNNLAAYDNLAVAYEKLDDRDNAIAVMLAKEKIKGGEYTTYANLGTFYLHSADFENGIANIRKAIQINPEAHFGREYVQLKMAEYYAAAKKDPQILKRRDFFGVTEIGGYIMRGDHLAFEVDESTGGEIVDLPANAMDGVVGIIRFGTGTSAELFLVLGEMLEARARTRGLRPLHLPYRAYLRAIELKHPRSEEIRKHLAERFDDRRRIDPAGYADATIARERADGAAWLKAYQDYEDALLRSGKNTDVEANYAEFYAKHPRIDSSYHWSDFRSWVSRQFYDTSKLWLWGLLFVSVLLVGWKVRSDLKKKRRAVV
jgi:Tfp pilus assembly protein PilF